MTHSAPAQPGLIKSRIVFCLVFLCFLAPVVIAYLALSTGWYTTRGTSNSGILIEPAITMESLKLTHGNDSDTSDSNVSSTEKSWRLLYILPEVCEKTCENRLIQIRQSIPALGPQKNRVKPLLITHNRIPEKVSQWLTASPIEVRQTNSTAINQGFANLFESQPLEAETNPAANANYLYVVDPWGQIILAYPPAKSMEEWLSSGKAMLKDLKHILKVSRIG